MNLHRLGALLHIEMSCTLQSWSSSFIATLFITILSIFTGPQVAAQPKDSETFVWIMQGDRIPSVVTKLNTQGAMLWEFETGQSLAIGVDPRDGSVWVPNLTNNEIIKLDSSGNVLFRVPDIRDDKTYVDPNDGSVWTTVNGLTKLDDTGQELFVVPGLDPVYSLVVDSIDSSVWVAVGGGSEGRKVVKLTAEGIEQFRRDVPGFFSNAPQQIDVSLADGSSWHGGFNDVFKWSADGVQLERLGEFDRVLSIAVDQTDGSVWLIDISALPNDELVKLDKEGNELLRKDFGIPLGPVAVDSHDGSAWVGAEGKVFKISSTGDVLHTVELETPSKPSSIRIARVALAPVPIDIDIKPGNKQNVINPRAKGGIWVAILSDTDPESPFDPPSQVDIPTVEFGPDGANATRHKVKDINKDGLGDLLLRFKIPQTSIACGDTEATLIGETFDGQSFTGTDSIKTVGCKPKKCNKKKHHEKHHDDNRDDDKKHHGKHNEKKHHKTHHDDHDEGHKKR